MIASSFSCHQALADEATSPRRGTTATESAPLQTSSSKIARASGDAGEAASCPSWPRVFALRGSGYLGSGFHWSVEKDLGVAIARLNNYDDGRYYNSRGAIAFQVGLESLVAHLEERVAEAERSARPRPPTPEPPCASSA
jgi:hypothetical protein